MYIPKLHEYAKKTFSSHNWLPQDTIVFVVANVKNVTQTDDYSGDSVLTDFFSLEEFEEIITSFRTSGFYVETFTDELTFIDYVQKGTMQLLPFKYKMMYNTSQKGTGAGRHSLIQGICKVLNIPLIGSNAYVAALCRHKYHCNKLVRQHFDFTPEAWLYEAGSGWLLDCSPPLGAELIIKPVHEAGSIGVSRIVFDETSEDIICKASIQYRQPITIEQFIAGYEVEVPILIDEKGAHALEPVAIRINDQPFLGQEILNYDNVYSDCYSFSLFREENPKVCDLVMSAAEKIAQIIGFQDYARLDFRIDKEGNFYLTDTTNNPHIVSHSAFYYCVNQSGLSHPDLMKLLFSLAANRNANY